MDSDLAAPVSFTRSHCGIVMATDQCSPGAAPFWGTSKKGWGLSVPHAESRSDAAAQLLVEVASGEARTIFTPNT